MKLLKLLFAFALMLMIYASPASAEYSYQMIVPPGSLGITQLFGINEDGIVTGEGWDGAFFSFTYDMESGEYTTSYELSVLEISNSGVMVGDVNGVCAIRDKKGNITTFVPPSWTVGSFCQARGVNSKGKVSGFLRDEPFDNWLGFIYDPKKDTYEEFLPSSQTFAVGINAQGQNVGSVTLDADEAYPGTSAGSYGYLRQKDGSVKYFAISESQGVPGWIRARGISENGLISGWYLDADSFEIKGYVTTLSNGTEFETITLTDDQILHQKYCFPNNPPPPWPEFFDDFTDMIAQQIRNDGVVVGSCTDTQIHKTTGEVLFHGTYGFIATPIE